MTVISCFQPDSNSSKCFLPSKLPLFTVLLTDTVVYLFEKHGAFDNRRLCFLGFLLLTDIDHGTLKQNAPSFFIIHFSHIFCCFSFLYMSAQNNAVSSKHIQATLGTKSSIATSNKNLLGLISWAEKIAHPEVDHHSDSVAFIAPDLVCRIFLSNSVFLVWPLQALSNSGSVRASKETKPSASQEGRWGWSSERQKTCVESSLVFGRWVLRQKKLVNRVDEDWR